MWQFIQVSDTCNISGNIIPDASLKPLTLQSLEPLMDFASFTKFWSLFSTNQMPLLEVVIMNTHLLKMLQYPPTCCSLDTSSEILWIPENNCFIYTNLFKQHYEVSGYLNFQQWASHQIDPVSKQTHWHCQWRNPNRSDLIVFIKTYYFHLYRLGINTGTLVIVDTCIKDLSVSVCTKPNLCLRYLDNHLPPSIYFYSSHE